MAWRFDLFVVHAAADADFVHGFLLPAVSLPPHRVLLVDDLMPGAYLVSEIAHAVTRSRYTAVVLSPAYLTDRSAVVGEQLASYLSVEGVHVIPLRLLDCEVPLQLQARVALDFTERARWEVQAARLRTLLQAAPPVTAPIEDPYPGTCSLAAGDASQCFGRGEDISDLVGGSGHGQHEDTAGEWPPRGATRLRGSGTRWWGGRHRRQARRMVGSRRTQKTTYSTCSGRHVPGNRRVR